MCLICFCCLCVPLLYFSTPICAFLSKSMLWVKCLECEINPEFHSPECQPFLSRLLSLISMQRCVNSQPNGPCRIKEVAGLKKQAAEIYPGTKCRSDGRTLHTPNLSPFFFQLEYGSIFFPVIVVFVIYHATTVD